MRDCDWMKNTRTVWHLRFLHEDDAVGVGAGGVVADTPDVRRLRKCLRVDEDFFADESR